MKYTFTCTSRFCEGAVSMVVAIDDGFITKHSLGLMKDMLAPCPRCSVVSKGRVLDEESQKVEELYRCRIDWQFTGKLKPMEISPDDKISDYAEKLCHDNEVNIEIARGQVGSFYVVMESKDRESIQHCAKNIELYIARFKHVKLID